MISIKIYNGKISERFLINESDFHCYATEAAFYCYKGGENVFQKFIDPDSILNVDRAIRAIQINGKITFIEDPKTRKLIGAQYV